MMRNYSLFTDVPNSLHFGFLGLAWISRPGLYIPTLPLTFWQSESQIATVLGKGVKLPCIDIYFFLFYTPICFSGRLSPSCFSPLYDLLLSFHSWPHCVACRSRLWCFFPPQQPAICNCGIIWACCPISGMTPVHLVPQLSTGDHCTDAAVQK